MFAAVRVVVAIAATVAVVVASVSRVLAYVGRVAGILYDVGLFRLMLSCPIRYRLSTVLIMCMLSARASTWLSVGGCLNKV